MPLPLFQQKKPLSTIKSIVAIAAGKGGVGKSTVTVNLALALKKMGRSVGILDTDIYGPSIRMMLPEDLCPKQKGETIIPAMCRGIPMISMAYFRPENEAAVVRAPIATGIIKQFLKNVVWGELDYLLIDFPPGTGDIQLTLAQEAKLSSALLVTTPQNVAVLDVRKAMHMFGQVNIPILGVVENMSYFLGKENEKVPIFGQGGGAALAQESGVPFLGQIPLDPNICAFGDLGKSLFEEESGQTAALTFLEIAKQTEYHLELLKSFSGEPFHLAWKEMH
ncbi:MAG TPA: Mrp/NBP35 family ATP-binding protein [Parachlamydiaceae bacterium]|nr:Mrp/NBP35 family ATP-binding protein [Parachlamydiaceae bacterium]